MQFFAFRCSTDHELFLALTSPKIPPDAIPLCSGKWILFRDFPKSGEPRLAFPSEEAIGAGVAQRGYYTFRAGVYVIRRGVAASQTLKTRKMG